MTIKIEGLNDPTLRTFVTRKLKAVTCRLGAAPVSARIGFTDLNGPKGGPDTRCALTLQWPRRPTLHVEEVAVSPRLAFDEALAGLERRLERGLTQARDERRRPKKYYVARRLLESGSGDQPWTSKLA